MRNLLLLLWLIPEFGHSAPALWLPINELSQIFQSTDAIQSANDSAASNTARITDEWTYARSTTYNYLACSTNSVSRTTMDSLVQTVGNSADVLPFFNDQIQDKSCFVVYASDTSEGQALEQNIHLVYIEPMPVAAKIDTTLLTYDSGTSTIQLDNAKFAASPKIAVSVFPKRLADAAYGTSLLQGLVSAMADKAALLSSDCQVSATTPLCTRHFMQYASSVSQAINASNNCNFNLLTSSVGFDGTILIDISTITSSYNDCGIALLTYFAVQPHIYFIEAQDPVNISSNAGASWVVQSGITDSTPVYSLGVTGTGQVVGISDTGVDEESCFFSDTGTEVPTSTVGGNYVADQSKRKVVMYIDFQDADDCLSGHGSHCAGSIAGKSANGAGPEATGVAPDAKLAVMDISTQCGGLALPDDMVNGFLKPMHDTGLARIHSASWGSNTPRYTYTSFQFDRFVYENPDHLVLIAAGNSGGSGSQTVGSPATFKNGLAVGASCSPNTNENGSPTFSSLGPTADGRLKPDIMAPGVSILSAQGGAEGTATCSATFKSGTSMATPVTAGAAALLRQYLMEGRLPGYIAFTPSAALLKAMIINSAQDVSVRYASNTCTGASTSISFGANAAPNNNQGFGRVQLNAVLPLSEGEFETYVHDNRALTSGESHSYNIVVASPGGGRSIRDLRITLVWTDPPASSAAGKILVHDLDLLLTHTNTGVQTFPNGRAASADTLNNVERIHIANTSLTNDDAYVVTVTAKTLVASTTQNYSLVITGNVQSDRGILGSNNNGGSGGGGGGTGGDDDSEKEGRDAAAAIFATIFVLCVIGLIAFIAYKRCYVGAHFSGFKKVSSRSARARMAANQSNNRTDFVMKSKNLPSPDHKGASAVI